MSTTTGKQAWQLVPALWDAHDVLERILAHNEEDQPSPLARTADAKVVRLIAADLLEFARALESQ